MNQNSDISVNSNLTPKSEQAYFAASNSYQGFISYFDSIFRRSDISHLYIIKGGPGTGKSRFMRECAANAEALGYEAEYYYCSSDQSSLDGIIIYGIQKGGSAAENIAVIDGTAPHSYDTKLPGIREDIINLGEFWDHTVLESYAMEIEPLLKAKSEAYKMAYDYLYASHSIRKITDSLTESSVIKSAMEDYTNELFKGFGKNIGQKKGLIIPSLIDSIGTLGTIRYDTFSQNAEKAITVNDVFGCAYILLDIIFKRACLGGFNVRVSYDPIEPSKIGALYIESNDTGSDDKDFSSLAIICDDGGYAEDDNNETDHISMRRFIETQTLKQNSRLLKHLWKMRSSVISCALTEFEKAGKAHFEIEGYYISAMNFRLKEEFSREFSKKLFGI